MSMKDCVHAEAKKRGWKIVRKPNELGLIGVPCFLKKDTPGWCEIWVGANESDQMQGGLEWQYGALHAAEIRGLTNGSVCDRNGDPIQSQISSHGRNDCCTLSLKRNGQDYPDAWDALDFYSQKIYVKFRTIPDDTQEVERPYKFQIPREASKDEIRRLDRVRGEKVAVIGLGGVGSWIADMLTKADVAEVHGWDGDLIESKNLIRMPGAIDLDWIGKKKARWFEETYSKARHGIYGHRDYITEQNIDDVCSDITFGFITVDNDKGRLLACEAFHSKGIPFIDVGIALDTVDDQVNAAIRIGISRSHDERWHKFILKVDDRGQDVYSRLELPDISAIAAGMAVESWRKVRGQIIEQKAFECIRYQVNSEEIFPRGRGEDCDE